MKFNKDIKNITKLTRALLLGNVLEFYDLTIYAFFHNIFAEAFFKPLTQSYANLYSWLCFAIAYLARPLGSLFFGYIGDKITRKKALLSSILGMALSTLLIGILPEYKTIGILSPILLVILRFMQGFSMGGECNGVAVYMLETFPQEKQKIGSLIIASTFCGALLGIIVILALNSLKIEFSLWRICFILGASIAFIGFYLRRFSSNIHKNENISIFKQLILKFKLEFFITLFLAGLNGSIGYILLGFLNFYLKNEYNFDFFTSLSFVALGVVSAIITSLIPAIRKPHSETHNFGNSLIKSSLISFPLCTISLCFLKINSLFTLISGCVLLGCSVGFLGQYLHVYVTGLFPQSCRYTGASLSFSLGMAIFGGTSPTLYSIILESKFSILWALIYPLILFIIVLSLQYNFKHKKSSLSLLQADNFNLQNL